MGFGVENMEEMHIRISLLNCFLCHHRYMLLFFNSLLGSCLVLSGLYIYLYGKAKEPQAKTTMSGSMDKELQVWPTRGSTSEDTASGP